MTRLVELGLVRREIPFGESEKTGRRAIYRINDPFFSFWFRVVAPHRAALAGSTAVARREMWTRLRDSLFSAAWETLCRSAASRLEGVHEVSVHAPWLPARRWWRGNAPEWDVVTTAADRSIALLGEVKWSCEPFEDDELEKLAHDVLGRIPPPDLPREAIRVIFVPASTSGRAQTRSGVRVVDAGAVMRSLM